MMPFGIELTPQDAIALVTTAIGAGTDLATRKIYNWLTFPTMAIGIGVNWYLNGIYTGFQHIGAVESLCGWLVALIIMLFPNPGKKMHFGDVKMMIAVGALFGITKFLVCMFFFSITYGIVSCALILKAIPREQIKGFWLLLKSLIFAGVDMSKGFDMTEVDKARKQLIPLGPIIFVGVALGIFLEKPLLTFLGFHVS